MNSCWFFNRAVSIFTGQLLVLSQNICGSLTGLFVVLNRTVFVLNRTIDIFSQDSYWPSTGNCWVFTGQLLFSFHRTVEGPFTGELSVLFTGQSQVHLHYESFQRMVVVIFTGQLLILFI